MAKIAVTDGMADDAVSLLEESGHEVVLKHLSQEELLAGGLRDFSGIVIRSATKLTSDIIKANPNLKVIGRAGVGVDNIDIPEATENGIMVVNAPRASTNSVVELTLAHLLASVRKIGSSDRGLRSGKWEKKQMKGTELFGKTLGLIGFGRIAQGVASIAKNLGMEVMAYDPYLPPKVARDQGVRLLPRVNDIFRNCTHISIHCNLTEETHHLVNTERISLMPGKSPNGIECGNHIINCARGGIVCESDALAALESGELSSLALDVFEQEPVSPDNPLLQHPNFHGTPHIGAATLEAQQRVGIDIVKEIMASLAGEVPQNLLNPDVLQKV